MIYSVLQKGTEMLTNFCVSQDFRHARSSKPGFIYIES